MTVKKSVASAATATRVRTPLQSGLQVNPLRRNAPAECEIEQSKERPAFVPPPTSAPSWPRVFPGL